MKWAVKLGHTMLLENWDRRVLPTLFPIGARLHAVVQMNNFVKIPTTDIFI